MGSVERRVEKRVLAATLLLGVAASCRLPRPQPSDDQLAMRRTYHQGERFRYRLTTVHRGDGVPGSTVVAVSSHLVAREGSALVERVTWERRTPSDSDDPAAARHLAPETVSLDPAWNAKAEVPTDPLMAGAVTDLFRFYWVARLAGVDELKRPGDRHRVPDLIKGNWSAVKGAKLGRDCTRLTVSLVAVDDQLATIRADYEVPEEPCLDAPSDWMKAPLAVRPNNFQQIKREYGHWFYVWGYASFTVTITLDRATGKILSGTMDNPRRWRMKICGDDTPGACRDETMTSRRQLVLEAL